MQQSLEWTLWMNGARPGDGLMGLWEEKQEESALSRPGLPWRRLGRIPRTWKMDDGLQDVVSSVGE